MRGLAQPPVGGGGQPAQPAAASSSASTTQATHSTKRAPVSFADLFSGPSLQESAASASPGASPGTSKSTPASVQRRLPTTAKITSAASPSHTPSKSSSKGVTMISFGSPLRGVPMKPASRGSPAQGVHRLGGVGHSHAGVAGSRSAALQAQLQQHGTLPRRGKLRRENAQKKQRLSHMKQIVLQVCVFFCVLWGGGP